MNEYNTYLAPFIIGGLSGVSATLAVHPIDGFKVVVQLVSQKLGIEGKSKKLKFLQIFNNIQQAKGLKSFYRGLDSAILRQLVYGSTRLGVYNYMINRCQQQKIQITNTMRIQMSVISGALGAFVGTPFDVALVRRQASLLNKNNPYKNTFHAFHKIIKHQGILTLWKGLQITIIRVVTINIGQLASHDIIKEKLLKLKYFQQHRKIQSIVSALSASLLTAAISLPVDNVKIKIQKSLKEDKTYTGILDCFKKTISREGVLRLWIGFPICLARAMPHSFILIIVQEYLRKLCFSTPQ